MKGTMLKSASLDQLKKMFDEGKFVIPEIQRNYVWDKNRILKLVDSIVNNYPIGVFLVWKTKGFKSGEIRQSRKSILPSFNPSNQEALFIIDGQQRLSSIYGLLNGNETDNSSKKIDFSNVMIDLNSKAEKRFHYKKNDNNYTNYFPLNLLLKTSLSKLKSRHKLSNSKLKILSLIQLGFKNYKFNFLIMETNQIEDVRETFVRINSQGMNVTQADVLFTKMTNIGLRELIESTKRNVNFIRMGYSNIRSENLIYTLAIASDETTNKIGKTALESFQKKFEKHTISKEKFGLEWKKFNLAFNNTVDFLTYELKVTHYKFLPSDNIFTMLALFFYELKKTGRNRPSSHQSKEIKKWFWHTSLNDRYSGSGFNKNIPSDIKFIKQLARKSNANYKIEEKIDPMDFLRTQMKASSNSSTFSAYYLFLQLKQPRYLENGAVMNLGETLSISNRRDRHHIFPKNLMNRHKSKWTDSLLNICLLASNENQSISDEPPYKYLAKYGHKKHFSKTLKSHLIVKEGLFDKNTKNGFLEFLNSRGPLILKEIEKTSGFQKGGLFKTFVEIKRI